MNKGLEAFYNIKDEMLEWTEGYEEDLDIVEKELKALEIIKKMFNDGNYLVRCNGHNYYIWDNVLMATSCIITKKEYDILKKVLL